MRSNTLIIDSPAFCKYIVNSIQNSVAKEYIKSYNLYDMTVSETQEKNNGRQICIRREKENMAINEKEKAKICFCEQCGSPLQPEDKFCSCCGQRIYTDKKFETVEDKDVQELTSYEKQDGEYADGIEKQDQEKDIKEGQRHVSHVIAGIGSCAAILVGAIAGVSANMPKGQKTVANYNIYADVLESISEEYGEAASYCQYALYDIDEDGIKELITEVGYSNADWMNYVYSIDEAGEVYFVGEFARSVVLYETEDGNGMYVVWGVQGVEEVRKITKNGTELNEEMLISKELKPGEDYDTYASPIKETTVDDTSLLITG